MKKIILIACSDQKKEIKSKAEELYISDLFKKSLVYAKMQKPDKIFILSALHHLVPLYKEIEPYNVTLSYVTPKKRKPGLKMLSSKEKLEWGKNIIEGLSKEADLKRDFFVILAGQEYIKPIINDLSNWQNLLKGLRQGQRKKFLKAAIS